MTIKSTTKTKTATKAKVKATTTTTVEELLTQFVAINREANELAAKARKARKELYMAMVNQGLTQLEVNGLACDRFAKESYVIDPSLLQTHLTPEQFWQIVKINKGDAQTFLPDGIIDSCSKVVMSNEDVHIRKY
jgi:hypothetical protein